MADKQPYAMVINQLVQVLKKINHPVTVDELHEYSNVNIEDPKSFKNKLRKLLRLAVRQGLVKEHNKHYYAASHAEDILPILKECDSPIPGTHSNQTSDAKSGISIASNESYISIISEADTPIGSDSDNQSQEDDPSILASIGHTTLRNS